MLKTSLEAIIPEFNNSEFYIHSFYIHQQKFYSQHFGKPQMPAGRLEPPTRGFSVRRLDVYISTS